jgi:hypothetical protein
VEDVLFPFKGLCDKGATGERGTGERLGTRTLSTKFGTAHPLNGSEVTRFYGIPFFEPKAESRKVKAFCFSL